MRRQWQWVVVGVAAALVGVGVWITGRLGWWSALVGGDEGAWSWVERLTFLLAILGAVAVGIRFVVGALWRSSGVPSTQRQVDASSHSVDDDGRPFVDRHTEVQLLRDALSDRRSRIVVVTGPAGVGKTRLIFRVLNQLGVRRSWHLATPQTRPDVMTLIDDMERVSGNVPADLLDDESLLGRLEAAVENLAGEPLVIVVDSAEHLLTGGSNKLSDLALDEAFETLATRPPHRVKIVFITQKEPVAAVPCGRWVDRAAKVVVRGLPRQDFVDLVRSIGPGREDRMATLPDVVRDDLYRWMHGRPRHAELFDAVVLTERGPSATDLATSVADWVTVANARNQDAPTCVADRLKETLITYLEPVQLRVLRALAALAIPVDAETVRKLDGDERPTDDRIKIEHIRRALDALRESHVIRIADDSRSGHKRFYLPPADLEWALYGLPDEDEPGREGKHGLLLRAANLLTDLRVPADRISRFEDLYIHVAEVEALLRAGEYDAAFGLLRQMDAELDKWNAGALLLGQREKIANHLEDVDFRMANYNRLGYLYKSRGAYREASDAYGKALSLAAGDDRVLMRIYVNLAGMYWAQNLTEDAYRYYDYAREIASLHSEPRVLTGALEGMARCHRRWGQYGKAFDRGTTALNIASDAQSPRAVHIAVKLARWRAEQDDGDEANRLIGVAEQAVDQHESAALRAVYLDVSADLQLDRNPAAAIATAQQAVDLALPMQDPVTVLQARTTICIAYLKLGDTHSAAREISLAERYRDMESSLIVLGLLAVVRRRQKPDLALPYLRDLRREAEARAGQDGNDFAAWQLVGLAIGGLHLHDEASLSDGVAAFEMARTPPAEPAPGLDRLMHFLLEQLAPHRRERAKLRPLFALLDREAPRPATG